MFPGQGGQSVGMGRELYNGSAAARAVFDEVDARFGKKLTDVIFNGSEEELNRPENVQAAVTEIKRKRPPDAKGEFIQTVSVASTMGPGVWVSIKDEE